MITHEMMMCRMFRRLCEEQFIMEINYKTKENSFKLTSSVTHPLEMKILKFISVERLIVLVKLGKHVQMKFLVCSTPEFIRHNISPKSILTTKDGKLTIEYRNS